MHRVKHFVYIGVVMTQDHYPLVDVIGRCSMLKESTVVLNARVQNMQEIELWRSGGT